MGIEGDHQVGGRAIRLVALQAQAGVAPPIPDRLADQVVAHRHVLALPDLDRPRVGARLDHRVVVDGGAAASSHVNAQVADDGPPRARAVRLRSQDEVVPDGAARVGGPVAHRDAHEGFDHPVALDDGAAGVVPEEDRGTAPGKVGPAGRVHLAAGPVSPDVVDLVVAHDPADAPVDVDGVDVVPLHSARGVADARARHHPIAHPVSRGPLDVLRPDVVEMDVVDVGGFRSALPLDRDRMVADRGHGEVGDGDVLGVDHEPFAAHAVALALHPDRGPVAGGAADRDLLRDLDRVLVQVVDAVGEQDLVAVQGPLDEPDPVGGVGRHLPQARPVDRGGGVGGAERRGLTGRLRGANPTHRDPQGERPHSPPGYAGARHLHSANPHKPGLESRRTSPLRETPAMSVLRDPGPAVLASRVT